MAAITARKNFILCPVVGLESTGVPNVLHQQCFADGDWQCIVPVCFDSRCRGTLGTGVLVIFLTCFSFCCRDIYLMVSTEYYFGTTFGVVDQ